MRFYHGADISLALNTGTGKAKSGKTAYFLEKNACANVIPTI
jgi:hypothetical protein